MGEEDHYGIRLPDQPYHPKLGGAACSLTLDCTASYCHPQAPSLHFAINIQLGQDLSFNRHVTTKDIFHLDTTDNPGNSFSSCRQFPQLDTEVHGGVSCDTIHKSEAEAKITVFSSGIMRTYSRSNMYLGTYQGSIQAQNVNCRSLLLN
uniref:Uncharacterized protein n=1 Tax=Otus sunia TaxID=257818 RepID=A0A8C8AL92_9STRI